MAAVGQSNPGAAAMAQLGAIPQSTIYHKFLVVPVTALTSGAHLHSNWRWHNELDRIYYQIGWDNQTGAMRQITIDVFLGIDRNVIFGTFADTWAYDTIIVACPGNTPIAGIPDWRTIPIGGEAMLGSLEFRVDITIDAFVGQGTFNVALYAAPERWFSFRIADPGHWPHP